MSTPSPRPMDPQRVADAMLEAAKLLPVQDDNRSLGSCSFNWWSHIARCLKGDKVQLESNYGPTFREFLAKALAALSPATGDAGTREQAVERIVQSKLKDGMRPGTVVHGDDLILLALASYDAGAASVTAQPAAPTPAEDVEELAAWLSVQAHPQSTREGENYESLPDPWKEVYRRQARAVLQRFGSTVGSGS